MAGRPPADGPVHNRARPAGTLASRAPSGCPSGWAGPGRQGVGAGPAVPVTGCQVAPVSGPLTRNPRGDSRYAVVPVSIREAAAPVPVSPAPAWPVLPVLEPADAPGTGAQPSLPGRLE